ncbi:hypothetical protein D1007_39277 [Hordeum vulgare]|nr:hypothetical protein D1007_39277 [Hordeum vulgare]
MDRGLVHGSSPLVGEMGEGHGWRSMNNLRPPFEQNNPSVSLASTSTSICSSPINSFSSLLLSNHYPLPTNSTAPWHDSSNSNQVLQLQDPWNHFMATNGQLANDEERHKALEGQALFPATTTGEGEEGDGSSAAGHIYSNTARHGSSLAGDEFQLAMSSPSPWSRGVQHYHNTLQQQASSITSTTSLGNNMLDFSNNGSPRECTSTASGAAFKKARTQEPSPAQSTVKVRKEKLGDRITALHQLVSPFGKTDTASVLLEAIGYIRFLHGQIEGLSSPYQPGGGGGGGDGGGGSGGSKQRHQASVQQRERSSIFPEEPGQQLLHGNATRKRGAPDQEDGDGGEEAKNDLRSRGLCLIPLSCAPDFGADVGPADYWTVAPPFGMGFGR